MDYEERMWAYLAGCVDCDGWISKAGRKTDSVLTRNYAVVVGITQHVKCKEGMNKIAEFMKSQGLSLTFTDRDSNTHHHTPMINITTKRNSSSLKFLERIEKYMLFKGDLARECIAHLKDKSERLMLVGDHTVKAGAKKRYWSEEELSLAQQLSMDGHNFVSIADKLGRSQQSVAQKLSRNRLTPYVDVLLFT